MEGHMSREKMPDVVVLLPGITGSVLKKYGKVVWGWSGRALFGGMLSGGSSMVKALSLAEDPHDVDDLGDGITADSLMSDLHIFPRLWKIDGYTRIAQLIQQRFDVTPGKNFFEFPYDWRRDNRVAARKLARQSHDWLRAWRESSGNRSARLILVAHSMGGLVSRYFLEVLDGWKDTRALVTFGTPYRGSVNALDTLANGLREGPMGVMDLSSLARTLTSIYQLLPRYPTYDTGDGNLVRVGETSGIPNVDAAKAAAALAFHNEIDDAVETHRKEREYRDNGYLIFPVVGINQPTAQSARRSDNGVEILRTYDGDDHSGDGTVPRVSAVPIEKSRDRDEMFAATRHASLQNADAVLAHLDGVLTGNYILLDQYRTRDAEARERKLVVQLSLDLEDLYSSSEPIILRARPNAEAPGLRAALVSADTGAEVAIEPLRPDADWQTVEFRPQPAGAYRVTVAGGAEVIPASDIFEVV
jgi:hypothetical protein